MMLRLLLALLEMQMPRRRERIDAAQNERVCAARLPGLHWATAPPPTRTALPTTDLTTATTRSSLAVREAPPPPDNDAEPRSPAATEREGKTRSRASYGHPLLGVAFRGFLGAVRGGRLNPRDRAPGSRDAGEPRNTPGEPRYVGYAEARAARTRGHLVRGHASVLTTDTTTADINSCQVVTPPITKIPTRDSNLSHKWIPILANKVTYSYGQFLHREGGKEKT
ncbi:hypothetical protein K0M31_013833 [Melipona bicolor]|uniref:Uncharacterized protein n=1 Tax=Melipona bicolor TaxID=60889 RepID=A0AA40G7D9_9HYME|nr:hypothetical protein K0M31_013833 [Melipona bicolor]